MQSTNTSLGSRRAVVKKAVGEVLAAVKWHRNPGGPKVAMVSQFLKEMGKKTGNVGVDTTLWNQTLQEEGFQVAFERLRFNSGIKPWVGKAESRGVGACVGTGIRGGMPA